MDLLQKINKSRWSSNEDEALRNIRQNLNYKSWNMISKKMASQFGFYGRTQKQCRDRYQNYIKDRNMSYEWNFQQQAKMFRMFVKEGSRWTLISSYFPNMKGVHLKNKFYTRIRKAIRKINSTIQFHFPKKYTPFTFEIVSKIVSLISNKNESIKHNCSNSKIFDAQKNQFARILLQLIQLTHNDEIELFPELQMKPYGKEGKKKLYKNLIKKLKIIEQIQTNLNPMIEEDNQMKRTCIDLMKSDQNDNNNERGMFQYQKKKCGYKQISFLQQHTKNHITIICKANIKDSNDIRFQKQKRPIPFKLQRSSEQPSSISKSSFEQTIKHEDDDKNKMVYPLIHEHFHQQNLLNSAIEYQQKLLYLYENRLFYPFRGNFRAL